MVAIRSLMLALAGVLVLLGAGAAGATAAPPGASYAAPLLGSEEVPPRTTPASGRATFQVSPDGQSLTYSVAVQNITNVTAGHIHLAPRGQNGDVVLQLVPTAPPGGGPKNGVIGEGTATAAQLTGPLQGKAMADLVAALDAGNAYVNIHTGAGATPATLQPGDLPPGELRGQIALAPAAAPAAATATRAAAGTAIATRTAPAVAATVTAAPTPPGTLPRTGGGYEGGLGVGLWAALATLLVLGAALALGVRRRA